MTGRTDLIFDLRPEFSQRDFEDMMLAFAKASVSDVTIETEKAIYIRLHADQIKATRRRLLDSEVRNIVTWVYGGNAVAELAAGNGLNTRYEVMREGRDHEIARTYFRFNSVSCRTKQGGGGVSITFRTIPTTLPVLDSPYMRLPEKLLNEIKFTNDGLTLVVGATGQGKTSLLAAWLHYKFQHLPNRKIVTAEAPVEYNLQPLHDMYPDSTSLISQREIGRGEDMESFYRFIVEALRQGPTDILIGESRDEETIRGTLHAAESGHATITTVHSDAVDTALLRVANEFPPQFMSQIVFKLCSQLRLVVVQRLLPPAEKGGVRVPVREWLSFDDEFRSALLRIHNPMEAVSLIGARVRELGQSFPQQARIAYDAGLISRETMFSISRDETLQVAA